MIMQQVEQGKLDLDADINTLIPFKVRNPKHVEKPITLRQLLTHTSGGETRECQGSTNDLGDDRLGREDKHPSCDSAAAQ